jgi:selenocysteine lyase/cysteine desulfurase
MEISRFREQVPITRSRAYLFSGALAPAALPVRAAWDAWTASWSADPNAVYTPDALVESTHALRRSFARLIQAEPRTIAITDNTSRAANLAVRVLGNDRTGNIVVDDSTYPSSRYPWFATGRHEVRVVATDGVDDAAGAIAQRVDSRTVAVCVSHVAPQTGRRHDLKALAGVAHEHGAALLVDAAQSTGAVPIDVERDGIDALVTTAMKWLMGPPGVGFLYLSPNVLSDAPVLDVGARSLEEPHGDWPADHMPTISADARRYELGLPNLPGIFAAKAGIDLLLAVGVDQISSHVERLATRCIDGLADRGADIVTPRAATQRAGVIAVLHPNPDRVFEVCRRQSVDIGSIGRLRIDPHGFNNDSDIDRFLECFDQVRSGS